MELKVKIIDSLGLHARPAVPLTKEAAKFKSELKMVSHEKTANLKSILSIMSLGVKNQEEVLIIAQGPDQEEALKNIERVMKENKLIA